MRTVAEMPPLLVPAPVEVEVPRCGERRMVRGDLRGCVDGLLASGLGRVGWDGMRGAVHPDLRLARGGDAGVHPGGYELRVHPGGGGQAAVEVAAGDEPGLRAALATLSQLLRQYGEALPLVRIADRPAFAVRGLMLDISRNKVPRMAQLRSAVELIASLKFNHLQLYTEHTFAYAGHEEVWRNASPMTADEVRELDGYCAAHGVELAANQNCFGHLAEWLRRERYRHLAEIEGDGAWRFMQWERRGPFSLCPLEAGSEALVRDLLGQLLPCFRSGLVNIGCDETFDVGWGRSRAEVERRAGAEFGGDQEKARASVYFEFVNRVCGIAREHGRRPMMWADIALHHPEMLGALGKDVVGLAWGYEPDAKFAEGCARLAEHGLEAWVCPGTSTWRSITGRTSESRGNLGAAAQCAGSARGFLVCEWGDVGHMQQWPLTMMRLADAAGAAWRGGGARFDARAASLQVFGDEALAIGPWLDELGDLDLDLRRRNRVRNATAIFNDLFPPVPPKPGHRYLPDAPLEEWTRIVERLGALESSCPALGGLVGDELRQTLAMARLAAEHGASCRMTDDGLRARKEDVERLRVMGENCLAELRRLWVERNRPGGLETASGHLRRVMEDWKD